MPAILGHVTAFEFANILTPGMVLAFAAGVSVGVAACRAWARRLG